MIESNNKVTAEKTSFTLRELLEVRVSNPWLVEGLLPKVGMACLVGPSDVGKSTFVKQLALEICMGKTHFLNYKINPIHKRVIYISSEDDKEGLASVLQRQCKKLNPDEDAGLSFLIGSENWMRRLKEKIESDGVPDLIVLDSFGDFYVGNPNDWSAVRKFLNEVQAITRLYECSILILHHLVKNSENFAPSKNQVNGSQSIEAKMRSVIDLRLGKDSSDRLLTVIKGNYIAQEEKNKRLIIRLCKETLTYVTDGKHAVIEETVTSTVKYDKKMWLPRIMGLRNKNLSIEAIHRKLSETFEDSPGVTTIKAFIREAGQSSLKEKDKPADSISDNPEGHNTVGASK